MLLFQLVGAAALPKDPAATIALPMDPAAYRRDAGEFCDR